MAIDGQDLVPVCFYVGQLRINHCGAVDLGYGGVPLFTGRGRLQWHARMLLQCLLS
jgi:hypothetical protein